MTRPLRHTLAAAALLAGHAAVAGAQSLPRIPFEPFTLPNGLQVILHEDRSVPLVAVNTWYHVGSGDEKPGRTGFAHLFEHIMFMGSQNVPVGQFDRWLEAAGAQNNGSTWFDRTNYFETVPATEENLTWALDLESDRMVNSYIAKKDLESEFTVVRNELESGETQPFRVTLQRMLGAAYDEVIRVDCGSLSPMVARPGDPGNGQAVDALPQAVTVDIAYGGSCTAGKREDFDEYHAVLTWGLANGLKVPRRVQLFLQYGTTAVRDYCVARGYDRTFAAAGARILQPSCGACANCTKVRRWPA